MNEMLVAIERLRFAVHNQPGVPARFCEAQSEQRPSSERRYGTGGLGKGRGSLRKFANTPVPRKRNERPGGSLA
jgi:hypothetical protein